MLSGQHMQKSYQWQYRTCGTSETRTTFTHRSIALRVSRPQVFDINLGLGVPFMIKALVQSKPVDLLSDEERLAKGGNDEIIPHVKFGFILMGILFVTLLGFKANRFRLSKYLGGLLFSM